MTTSDRKTTPPPKQLPHKMRPGMLALAVLLILLGALGATWLATQSSSRVPVLMTTRDVPVGLPLSTGDLTTVQVSLDSSVATIPASQLREVVGKVTSVPLRKGTLIAASELTTGLSPSAGQQIVPIALTPAQIPARYLSPGDQVMLVITSDKTSGTSGTPAGQSQKPTPRQQGSTFTAAVDRVGGEDSSGKIVVDLLVTADVGPQIARYAAEGRLAVIITAKQAS